MAGVEASASEEYQFDFKSTYESLIDSGIQYYMDKHRDIESKILKLFRLAKTILEQAQPFEEKLSKSVELFDFVYPSGERVKGNGFRSLLYVYNSALTGLQDALAH